MTLSTSQQRREQVLSKVRQALGHEQTQHPAKRPMRDETLIRMVPQLDPERVGRWIQLAQRNGIEVQQLQLLFVASAVEEILTRHQAQKVLFNAGPWQTQLQYKLQGGAARSHYQWGQEKCREMAFHCDASITTCRYGLADSGGFLFWSDADFGRSSTLTAPVHIVLLTPDQILADMIDGLAELTRQSAGKLPSNAVIVNGPSKTADIEMNLVTGVHGPKYVYGIIIQP